MMNIFKKELRPIVIAIYGVIPFFKYLLTHVPAITAAVHDMVTSVRAKRPKKDMAKPSWISSIFSEGPVPTCH